MSDEERKAVAKLARLVAGLAILLRKAVPQYTNAIDEVIEHAQEVDAHFAPQTKEPTDE